MSSIEVFSISSYTKSCNQTFTDHLNAIWYRLQVTEATNGFSFQIINSWMELESWPGLTVTPPSETWELFWAIFVFTTLFISLNMVLQRDFFPVFGTERSQRAFTSKFLIICSCKIKVRQLQRVVFHHKKKDILNFFLASTIWTYLKISFSLKLISKETLFAQKFGSHLVNADWLLTRQVKQTLDYVNKGAVDTLGARGFSCAVSGFVSSACGQRNEAPRRTRGKTSGTQGRQLMAC